MAGLAAGPLTGLINPQADFGLLYQPMIGLAVGVILFEGGLNLNFSELRSTRRAVLGLVFVGGPATWILGAAAGH